MPTPTNAPRNIAADLDSMLKRGSAKKAELTKKAEEVVPALDAAEVGKTVAPTSGTQTAGIMAEQSKTYTAGAIDAGAETNQPNASVTNSPQGAAAASTNGEKGAKTPTEEGSTVTTTTVNGDALKGGPEGNDTSGAFKSAAAKALLKTADELEALAEKCIDPLHRFLAKAARANTNPEIKKVADGMDDQDLGQAASGNLTDQIEQGGISDEEAAQILAEAVSSGAISQEELEAAVAELKGGAGADGAAAAPVADAGAVGGGPGATDAAAGDVPPVPAAPGASDAAAMPPMPADAGAKMAAAHISPEHPEYTKMVAANYPTEVEAGRKLAALIFEQGQAKVASAPKVETKNEATTTVVAEVKVASALIEAKSDDEKRALAAVQKELGIDDSQLKALSEAPSKPMDKHASLAAEYRATILKKIASLA